MIDTELEFPTITPDSTPEEIAQAEAEADRIVKEHNARIGYTDEEAINDVDDKVENYNENHDPKSGQFSSGNGITDAQFDKMAEDFANGKLRSVDDWSVSDEILAEVYRIKGYNAKPKVIPTAEYEASLDAELEVFRGLRESYSEPYRFTNDLKYGDKHFAGMGIYGNGTYTSPDYNEAVDYSNNDEVVRMYLSEDAKEADYEDMTKKSTEFVNHQRARVQKMFAQARATDDKQLMEKVNQMTQLANRFHDAGVYAASQGIDYLKVTRYGAPYFVILNRGKLTIDESPYKMTYNAETGRYE